MNSLEKSRSALPESTWAEWLWTLALIVVGILSGAFLVKGGVSSMLFAGLTSIVFVAYWSVRYGRDPTRSLVGVLLIRWDDIRFLNRGMQYFYFFYYDIFLVLFHIFVIFCVIASWYDAFQAARSGAGLESQEILMESESLAP